MFDIQSPGSSWPNVPPVRASNGSIVGTCIAAGNGHAVTALHVVDGNPSVYVGDGLAVVTAVSLPARRFGAARTLARHSYRRARLLVEEDLGTVDLALLVVPELNVEPIPIRREPVRAGERVLVAGYPQGRWTVAVGPIAGADDAEFLAHLLLGPGASGAAALDGNGHLAGLLTLDHDTAGALFIGPALISAFVERASRLIGGALV